MSATTWNPLDHHRGPFELAVVRPRPDAPKGRAPYTYEKLRGTTAREDVADEARSLLGDPRDTIDAVYVFSVTEQQHVTTYRKEGKR